MSRTALLATLLSALSFSCQKTPSKSTYIECSGRVMGTTYHIKLVFKTAPDTSVNNLCTHIQELLSRVDSVFTTFKESSELMQINRSESDTICVSEWMWDVLKKAKLVHWLTHGAFDPTVAPLVSKSGTGSPLLNADTFLTGFNRVKLYDNLPQCKHAIVKPEYLLLDLNGISKGFGIQLVFESVSALSPQGIMVEVGGDLKVAGVNKNDKPWKIGIEDPLRPGTIWAIIKTSDTVSVATSGEYLRGEHIIGEKDSILLVSVISKDAALADGLATGLYVLGCSIPEDSTLLSNLKATGIQAILLLCMDNSVRKEPCSQIAVFNKSLEIEVIKYRQACRYE